MKFRYREMIYRPDFYQFDNSYRTEWFPNGIFHYNISRMMKDLQKYETSKHKGKEYLDAVVLDSVSVEKAIKYSHGVDGLQEEHIDAADLSRPLLFAELAPDCYNLIDGKHRLAKAQKMHIDMLPAYYLPAHAAIRYLGGEDEYCRFVEYWNYKIEDIHDQESYQGLFAPFPAPWLERNLDATHIWCRILLCLDECRRVELYSEGEWFTLFRLNGKIYCGEAEAHEPSIKCASPFAITERSIEIAVDYFESWQGAAIREREPHSVRRDIRMIMRHAAIIMACVRIFSEY